jgi:hypothetical protein
MLAPGGSDFRGAGYGARRDPAKGSTPVNGPGYYREAGRLLAEAQTSTGHYYSEQDAISALLADLRHLRRGHLKLRG